MDPTPADDDAQLIHGTLAGRREDFDLLVQRHQKPLYMFAYRFVHDHEEAADIVQSTFLQAYTHLRQFAGRASFKTWLHQIALNQCRARHRGARGKHTMALDDVDEGRLAVSVDPAPSAASARPLLERLIARLPLRQRAVLVLRIFSDLPFKEIARAEGISENSAKVNYHHAITRLRQWVREGMT